MNMHSVLVRVFAASAASLACVASAQLNLPVSPQNCFMMDPPPPECASMFGKKKPEDPMGRWGKHLKFSGTPAPAALGGAGACATPQEVREAVKVALEDLGVDRSREVDSTDPFNSARSKRGGLMSARASDDDYERRDKQLKDVQDKSITKKEKDVLQQVREINKTLKDTCKGASSSWFDAAACSSGPM